MASSFSSLAATVAQYTRSSPTAIVSAALAILAALIALKGRRADEKEPPSLPDTIPFISNTFQYLTNIGKFLDRATKAMQDASIIQFHLGPKKVYLVHGSQNTQPLLRMTNDVGSEAISVLAYKRLFDMSPEDIAKFAADKSGRLKRPSNVHNPPGGTRYWYGVRHIYEEYMMRPHYANSMADKYYDLFSARLEEQPVGEWNSVSLLGYLKEHMAGSAIVSLCGQRILDLNPGFVKQFWSYDEVVFYLLPGPPKWLNRHPWKVRGEFLDSVARYVGAAWENFDWSGPAAHADWEENFGSRFSRECARWSRGCGLSMRSARGLMALMIFGVNSNTTPITAWAMYELVKDPDLYQEVRKEVVTAFAPNPSTGERTINTQKLVSLPLLQSVLTETMRVHLSLNLLREVKEPIVIEGYTIKKGSLVQAMTRIAHHDEAIWGCEGHPASEFWARRHLRGFDKDPSRSAPQFSVAGEAGCFVPFGGGPGMCLGRLLAKQEILLTLAAMIVRFDVEFVDWMMPDGGPSDRAAQDDAKYAGSVAMPPDRDMKIRWKRLW